MHLGRLEDFSLCLKLLHLLVVGGEVHAVGVPVALELLRHVGTSSCHNNKNTRSSSIPDEEGGRGSGDTVSIRRCIISSVR